MPAQRVVSSMVVDNVPVPSSGLFVGRDLTVLAGSLTGSGVVVRKAAEAAHETPPCCESSPPVDRHATGDKPLTHDTDRRGEAASQGTSRRRRRL